MILAATGGFDKIVEILLNNAANMEAQSERTKDTPLSLACSGGRYEVRKKLLRKYLEFKSNKKCIKKFRFVNYCFKEEQTKSIEMFQIILL